MCGVGFCVCVIKQRPTKQGIGKEGFSFLVIKLGKYNHRENERIIRKDFLILKMLS